MKSEKGKTKSEKVRTSILFTFSLLLFTSAASAETVEYWDPVGKVTNSVEAVVVTGATTTLTGGWYVVTGEVSRAQINVTGTEARPANLILADGAKLTARDSSDYHPGIKVASGAALNVYAQSVDADTMGQLSATGGDYGAGIGGAGEGGTCGTVNIYGGKLTAVGGEYAAGIGGGGEASKTGGTGGTISIYGGIVTANGENGGAAIGGGSRADGGVISIYGGEVIADNTKGDSEGAGIGGGYAGAGGMILIAGGKVTAVGGYKDDGGAGIGGGEEGSGGTVMITGGIVNATGTDYGAGIGGGDEGAGGDVTISGGTVVAKAGKSSVWDIGSGSGGGDEGEFVVTGGSVLLANSGLCRDGYPKNGDGTQVYGVMMAVLEANAAMEIDGLADYGTNDIYTDESGRICLYLPSGSFSFTLTDESQICSVTVVDGQASVVPVRVRTSYWDPVSGVEKSEYCIVVDGSTVLKDGDWYVVTGKVARGSVVVNGKANLILRDGCELKATGGANQAGVSVNAGNSLTIYGQMAGTGKLTAKGGDGGAGIGGIEKVSCGAVTINGGTVTATGGLNAAGIGGGRYSAGGKVMVNGGTVTATGAQWGAGIGGGSNGAGGAVTIINGRLDVKAGEDASVIGAGIWHNSHGTVAISGGIFSWKPNDAWIADPETVSFMSNSDSKTARDYPWAAVKVGARVTFARPLEHMTAAWTSGDGSVTNAISGTTFVVPKGAKEVKFVFTPEERYWLDKTEYVFDGAIAEDCTIPADALPTATCLYAVVTVGQLNHMTAAWTSGDGLVTNAISGTTFWVPVGTTGVKIIFTPKGCYMLDKTEYVFASPINEDCTIPAEALPTALLVWPEGYVRVEYIASTFGGGQYIDTGVKASSTLQATMDYMAFEHTGRVNLGTFAADNADWRYFDHSGGPVFDCGSARTGSTSGNTLDLNVRYVVNVGTEGNNINLVVTNAVTQSKVKSFTAARSGAPSAENVFIFGGYSGDSLACTSMRLYSLTLRDFANVGDAERTTLAEFVPCVRASDRVAGLYDIENGVFKENEGSGSFVAKNDLLATVTVPNHAHVIAFWTSGDGSVTNRISGAEFLVLKDVPFKVLFTPEYNVYALEGPSVYESAGISGDLALTDEQVPVARALPIEYVDEDGSIKTLGEYDVVTDATTVLASGWYVVVGKISRGSIAVSGDVKLILADGCELTATGGGGQAGVAVSTGNSLTIYGQTANTGRLTAAGGPSGAGIGGGEKVSCGAVTINGGTVTAKGGWGGAGIGGGSLGGYWSTVTINGGTVTATGGTYGAGIGGGLENNGVGTVTISGGRLNVRAGEAAMIIGSGHNRTMAGTTRIFGGVFSWKPDEGWLADRVSMGVFLNLDAETRAGYPWTVKYLESVVIFEQPLVGMTAAWTSGDGTKTNEICGAFFKVPMGATDAKIVFTPESNYRFVEDGETGIRELPSPLVEDVTITPPRVERITVPTAGPWNVGDAVTAYVSDDGTLVIGGTGAMDDFASAADAPWDPAAVARVTVADDVTLGKNALAALSDTIRVSANESIGSMRSALGTSTGPSGAISAGFESIEVLDGKAYLGVAVKTNVNLTAEAQDWGKVGLEAKDVSVENGSVIIAVPANTEQGFFYLMSKPAVPSDKGGVPFQPTPRLMSGEW